MPRHNSMVVFHTEVKQRRKFAKKRILSLLATLVVCAGLWALLKYSEPLNLFTLQHVQILNNHRVTSEEIRTTLGLHTGTGLFNLDMHTLQRKVEKMTWVKSVKIRRTLPDILTIRIEEYVPTAVLLREKPYLISSEGHLLPPAPAGYVVNLPVITNFTGTLPTYGTKIPDLRFLDAVSVLAEMKQYRLFGRVSEVRFVNTFQYRLYMDEGRIELLLGKKRRESISAVESFLHRMPANVTWSDIAYIDATAPGFIALNNQSLESVLTPPLPDKKKPVAEKHT